MEVLLSKSAFQQPPLPGISAKNTYRQVEFTSGMTLTEFSLEVKKSNIFRLTKCQEDTLTLIYNHKEPVKILFFKGNASINLSPLANVLVLNKKNNYVDFDLSGGKTYKLSIIEIPDNCENQDLKNFYKKFVNTSNNFNQFKEGKIYPHSSPNLEITKHIKELWELEKNSLYDRLLANSLITIILVLKFKEYQKSLKFSNLKDSNLTSKEIDKIYLIKDEILNFPEEEFRLDYFCKKHGMNVQKVQTGFKSLYGKTLGSYIKYIRIKKAEELMRTTNMNISEIVYTIGFSSRSYFSKIFKETYECSPKKYHEKLGRKNTSDE